MLRQREPQFVTMAPSDAGMRDPLFRGDIEFDLIGDAGWIFNNDPRTLVERIKNLARSRLATISVEIETAA
jgi:hypothetical protein